MQKGLQKILIDFNSLNENTKKENQVLRNRKVINTRKQIKQGKEK